MICPYAGLKNPCPTEQKCHSLGMCKYHETPPSIGRYISNANLHLIMNALGRIAAQSTGPVLKPIIEADVLQIMRIIQNSEVRYER